MQNSLLVAVKSKLPASISFVDELAEVLNISKDSAYRRIRGEKSMDIREIQVLVQHYDLSLDSILNLNKNFLSFESKSIDLHEYTIARYFTSIQENLGFLSQFDHSRIIVFARDVPIFYYFSMPEICNFKVFFWLKTYLKDPALVNAKYDPDNLPPMVLESAAACSQIWKTYAKIPSIEIWTDETINSILKQIYYYKDACLFARPELAGKLTNKLIEMLHQIQKQAEAGRKAKLISGTNFDGGTYDLYYNEVAQGDNSVLFDIGVKKIAFITYCTLNYLSSSNEVFCNYIDHYFKNLLKTSSMLSRTSERDRNKFFNNMFDIVNSYVSR